MSECCSSEALGASLRSFGLPVRTPWVASWLAEKRQDNSAAIFNKEAAEAALSEAFLCSDLRETGEPQIPRSVASWHKQRLTGVYVLQLLMAVNINEPHKTRDKTNINKHRCLKLALTDGHVVVPAIEYKMIKTLKQDTLGMGAKFLVYGHPEVRRGIIFLQENNLQVLWGGYPPPKEEGDPQRSPPQVLLHPPMQQGTPQGAPLSRALSAPAAPTGGHSAFNNSAMGPPSGRPQQVGSDVTVVPRGTIAVGQGPRSSRQYSSGQLSHAAWPASTGACQEPSMAAHQGPPSYASGQSAESSLLIDLEDIADALSQETSPLASGAPHWEFQEFQRPPRGPPQEAPQGPPQGTFQELPQKPPQEPPKEPSQAFIESSRACETCPGVSNPPGDSPSLQKTAGGPQCFSVGHGGPALIQSQQTSMGAEKEGALFWLFGAIIDAREGREKGEEWELLVTDGMRVFLAFASGAVGQMLMLGVKQTALFSPIPAVEQLRNVRGYFLLEIRRKHGDEQQVNVVSFRANAPEEEVSEKLEYLYAAITEERE